MQIARVCGTVVGTHKLPSLTGVKFLLLQLVDLDGRVLPEYEVAADPVGAGIGEWVLVARGSAARQDDRSDRRPLDALVVAIIDTVSGENGRIYSKSDSY
ncbi:carbon dioxide concentrating mechanism/carboxysome shell protein [Rubidibacter lacunae KORDI 51-2]|uniref:Carboxysome shell vertex protein CcmL n=1 Tax=Rubidibacter lacunae KORDI 51-2 TaxID=582515 RepID=U5DKI2_9CHRO|nr:EutN/CcmL family microcompartment protein [Rubidibacter lacunae]ERN41422.1 carbon dioxide concentrating mechanism/carboxysome shell protein [Rubidibacter lacunae KORDI 51-2]